MHRGIIKTIFLIVAVLNITGCRNTPKKYLPEQIYRKLLSKCPDAAGKELEIYYMDGDCSFCIAKAIQIDNSMSSKPNYRAIFITRSDNTLLIEYYFKEKNIKSCLIADKDSIMENSNINLNEVVLILKDLSITPIMSDK